ncbi:OmpA family protein [Parvibaculum sp.]|uniref:OmpA family protein n=1 Tax=Parvibaculum sp. TaxID=2024848 RepID=UPI0026006E29|nr:OmpA family protein [Parvibaculum sp.]
MTLLSTIKARPVARSPLSALGAMLGAAIWLTLGASGLAAAEAPLSPPKPALVRVLFEPETAVMGQTSREDLSAFAEDFRRRSGRLELRAYAGPPHDTSSNARRLALKRALSVRRVLVSNGVTAERIYVRALGGTSDSGPTDRVDVRLFGG